MLSDGPVQGVQDDQAEHVLMHLLVLGASDQKLDGLHELAGLGSKYTLWRSVLSDQLAPKHHLYALCES